MSTLKHRFKYIKAGKSLKPVVSITLRYNGKEFDYMALVDSGADFNIFHPELSYILDIDLTKLEKIPFVGIQPGEEMTGYVVPLEIGIGGRFYPTRSVMSFQISDSGYGVLGQLGFFDIFKVQFDRMAKDILLK